ncbi:MAG: FIST C-terminal domain-containing protein [Candidatus Omnitrophica bacterium]|nr:FIST C-terminal domain-containing protein [Candidatus Omnitrophota bacterium]MCF7877409.1 FIST C-terminal domain-containing protein [Candidatus Omnitrophota bacterium]MCF7878622.1 FIST C-terminal domain-containing protein [Candidatus Omnitrophota bacterium]MCF7892640.1 FIST C-terminal domain-containing protein [Candidatus Omnitrophota bacterium]
MKNNQYSLHLSQKNASEAAKQISLEIKAKFRNKPFFIFILFTPDYNPKELSRIFNLTLNNPNLLGVQAPSLIYKGAFIEKGIIGCCICKEKTNINSLFIGSQDSEKIEYILKKYFKKIKRKDIKLISFLSPQVNSLSFLEGLNFSLGKLINFSGTGHHHKYSPREDFIIKKGVGNGLVNLTFDGIATSTFRLQNFVVFGKPFTITRINPKQQIIYEINNKPAVEIYKHYFEEKFNSFIENHLFPYYPLGISSKNSFRLLTIVDILEDGSFLFRGNLRNKTRGNLTTLRQHYSKEHLIARLGKEKNTEEGPVFIINSLNRKKILGQNSVKEIENIKEAIFPKKEIFGICSDYYLFPDPETQDINIESGGLLLNVWD